MSMIYDNLQRVRAQIDAACTQYGRPREQITLLAVSKTHGADAVREAAAAGQRDFGENYIQEGVDKLMALQTNPPAGPLVWHLVGPIQSNKTQLVASHFDWVHSIDRLKIAQRLSAQRPPGMAALQVCVQVNIDAGANKSGVLPGEALALAQAVAALPGLHLRGIMVIPEPAIDFETNYAVFAAANRLFDALKTQFPGLDTLSMGMSADLAAAVAAGSTMVRVGTAIFGARG